MNKDNVIGGLLGAIAGVVAKSAFDYIASPKEPEWAKDFMKHIRIGGLARENEALRVQFVDVGSWEKNLPPSAYYLVWREAKGEGLKDLQAHIELRPPTDKSPYYILEIYHSWGVPKETLLQTDLKHEIALEKDFILVARFPTAQTFWR